MFAIVFPVNNRSDDSKHMNYHPLGNRASASFGAWVLGRRQERALGLRGHREGYLRRGALGKVQQWQVVAARAAAAGDWGRQDTSGGIGEKAGMWKRGRWLEIGVGKILAGRLVRKQEGGWEVGEKASHGCLNTLPLQCGEGKIKPKEGKTSESEAIQGKICDDAGPWMTGSRDHVQRPPDIILPLSGNTEVQRLSLIHI